ncbi:putative membrane protein [Rubidibacter lacunae KORDI 51-2]|uniref:Putative membrane protein n=1 Tax=Rubidibacter lacunae KORDI 51-2 TaxID=582515 RepID=U5DFF8_9CHRO|nr:MAPEG family protein [Rubidibacter lacunae]ERN40336.1 putative membrane protein [Rubidibacter lacunae KORDI 51-2]
MNPDAVVHNLPIPLPALLLYSIVGAVLLVYLPYGLVAFGRFQVGYDARAPRTMFDKLPAYAQRATWAHQNGFESLTIYVPAALMAYVTHVDSSLAAIAAIGYLGARLLYPLGYVANLPILRSLAYAIGVTGIVVLFALSLQRAAAI